MLADIGEAFKGDREWCREGGFALGDDDVEPEQRSEWRGVALREAALQCEIV